MIRTRQHLDGATAATTPEPPAHIGGRQCAATVFVVDDDLRFVTRCRCLEAEAISPELFQRRLQALKLRCPIGHQQPPDLGTGIVYDDVVTIATIYSALCFMHLEA